MHFVEEFAVFVRAYVAIAMAHTLQEFWLETTSNVLIDFLEADIGMFHVLVFVELQGDCKL